MTSYNMTDWWREENERHNRMGKFAVDNKLGTHGKQSKSGEDTDEDEDITEDFDDDSNTGPATDE